MADLSLTDTMNPSKPLLQPVGIPWQVIVDHQMRSLQVDTFTCGVGGNENADILVLLEPFLYLAPFVPEQPAVNGNHRILTAQQGCDFVLKVAEGIPVFRKDDQLFPFTFGSKHTLVVLEQLGQLAPLPVLAALAHIVGHSLQSFQRGDFGFQLGNRPRSGSLVNDFLLFSFQLSRGKVIIVKVIIVYGSILRPPASEPLLCKPAFQPLSAPFQRLINRLW